MEINNFKDMYLAELQELVSVEEQLGDALLRMAGAASHPELKRVLICHRWETETQRDRLTAILQKHGANPSAHTDQAMQALVVETKKMLTLLTDDDLRDEQKMLHLGLEEEKQIDVLLTQLAKREVNPDALAA